MCTECFAFCRKCWRARCVLNALLSVESEQTLEEIQRETGRDKQIHRQQDRQQHSLEEEFSEIKAVNDTLEKVCLLFLLAVLSRCRLHIRFVNFS